MKIIKFTFLTSSLFCLLGIAKADEPKKRAVFTIKFSISSFIDVDAHDMCDGLADIINDNAKFTMVRGDQLISCNKKQIVNHLKKLRGV